MLPARGKLSADGPLLLCLPWRGFRRLRLFSSGRVAVCSSGTAVDLLGAWAAGMHDTFFSVPKPTECLRFIRQCWVSL